MSSFHELRVWLQSDGERGPSETGLTALLRHLPDLSPPPGLADAVLRELGLSSPHRPLSVAVWGARAAIAASLLLTACAFLLLPLLRLVPLPQLSDLVSLTVLSVQVATTWWIAAVTFWDFLFAFAEKATLIFTAPEAMVGLAVTLLVGLVAFRWLLSLTHQHWSARYAETV